MHLITLSLAFSAAVYAAPMSTSDHPARPLSRRDDELYTGFLEAVDFDTDARDGHYDNNYPEEDYMSGGGSRYLSNEDDPAFAPIFQHIEDILYSGATPEEQLERIVDAIVHHQESTQGLEAEQPSSDEVVFHMFKILDSDEKSSDEKIEEIFDEIMDNTKHAQLIELDDPAGAALYRIRWMLEEPMSAQKRVQMILNELADQFHPEQPDYGAAYEDSQETFEDTGNQKIESFEETGDDKLAALQDAGDDDVAADIGEDMEEEYRLRGSLEDPASTDWL